MLFILILGLPLKLFGATIDPSQKWLTIKTEHFAIHFADKLEAVAKQTAQYLEEAHAKLSPKLKWKPWGLTHVIVSDSDDSPNGMASTLPYNWMFLRVTAPNPDNAMSSYDNWLRTLVFHEYTHILNLDKYGGPVTPLRIVLGKVISPNGTAPGWIREGLPTYIETVETTAGRGRSSYAEMLLRTAILQNEFPAIDEADGLGWKWPSYQTMYIYGVKFLQFVADKYGEDKLMEFQDNMAHSLFFYGVNHQARHTFTDPKLKSKKTGNHFTLEKDPEKPRSATFYNLWKEWQEELKKKYALESARLEAGGLTEFEKVVSKETILSSPAISSDGKYLAYMRGSAKRPSELHLIDTSTGRDRVIKKRQFATHISFSPDGGKIAYSVVDTWKTYNRFSDIYIYDIATKKSKKITHGLRASSPSFSPDGERLAIVKQDKGTSWMATYDIKTAATTDLKSEDFSQAADPSWSHDGKHIAVSMWRAQTYDPLYEKGQWDIYIYDAKTLKEISRVTNDRAVDSHPVFGPLDKELFFSSDRDGINNIYKADITNKHAVPKISKTSNTLTGISQPTLSPDGKTIYVQYYNGSGFDIRSFKPENKVIMTQKSHPAAPRISLMPPADTLAFKDILRPNEKFALKDPKKYSPFGKALFLPRFFVPTFATLDSAVQFGAFTGSADPLQRHTWMGGVNFRTDYIKYPQFFFNYGYNRWYPSFNVGTAQYLVNYGSNVFPQFCTATDSSGKCISAYSKHYFEKRTRGYGGISVPWGKQMFLGQYFYEHRGSNLTATEAQALANVNFEPNLGRYAGFSFSYSYGDYETYPASISRERGRRVRMNFTITDKWLYAGENNEQRIYAGDYREYISLWANHVLALRAAGAMTWGDRMIQGNFTMGGTLSEGMFGGGDSLYYFPLRGIPIASLTGTRALLFSSEYRLPFITALRGLGTMPVYLKDLNLAAFADYGNTWNASTNTWGGGEHFFNHFLLSTGLELRADFIFGHGLPVSGRIGYGIVVVNRGRLGTVTDPILKTPAKKGMLVLQLGTAF